MFRDVRELADYLAQELCDSADVIDMSDVEIGMARLKFLETSLVIEEALRRYEDDNESES